MARRCNAHLKRNDFVSVSGRLVFPSNSSYHYQVNVMEVNYVKVPTSDSQNTKLETEEDDKEESKKDEHCLWREYIENPSEWWDNRKNKKNPKQPDFKRKDTGEVLWIDSKKPIWVSKELELLDQIEETGIEKSSNDVIYLWQVFFANPSGWWDRRTTKKNPKQPDFKHKDTDEALWIDSDVPVWVIRQLELFDQRKANKEETRFDKFSDWL